MKYKYPGQTRDVWKLNPELRTVDEYAGLNASQMCFVMLVGDPESPHVVLLRQSEDDRILRRAAAFAVGWSSKRGVIKPEGMQAVNREDPVLEKAIAYYRQEALFEIAEARITVGNAMAWINDLVNNTLKSEYAVLSEENADVFKVMSSILKDGIMSKGLKQFKDMKDLMKEEIVVPLGATTQREEPAENTEEEEEQEEDVEESFNLPDPNA